MSELLTESQDRYSLRLQNAQRLFELCLDTYDDEDLKNGVYAEIHGYSGSDAILAVPPLLKYIQLAPGSSEYNHSVFDDIELAKKEYPEIYELAWPTLGLRKQSVIHRGILFKKDDGGKFSFGITDMLKKIRKDVLDSMSAGFSVTNFFLLAESKKTEFRAEDFGTKLAVKGSVFIEEFENGPPITDLEVGIAEGIEINFEDPRPSQIHSGTFGSIDFSAISIVSGHRTHTQLENAINNSYHEHEAEPVMPRPVELILPDRNLIREFVKLRHTNDRINNELKIDLIIDPYEETDRRIFNPQNVILLGAAILSGYADGIYLSGKNYQVNIEYADKPTVAVISVNLTEAKRIMQNIVEFPTLSDLSRMKYDNLAKRLNDGWRSIASVER